MTAAAGNRGHGRPAPDPAAPAGRAPKSVTLIGGGAIGRAVIALLADDPAVRIGQVIVPPDAVDETAAALGLPAAAAIDATGAARPDLVVECAGHRALEQHVLPALAAGIPAVVASIGALGDGEMLARLEQAAIDGATRVELVTGAIGGIDALAAARVGGLDEVVYIGRKPPGAWEGTPAAERFDLAALTEPTVLFEGSAGEAARLYPRNANVAATVSLAGLGFDRTQARLIADPGIDRNVHQVRARGAFGEMALTIENFPLPDNPKTSALTVYSIVRAIRNITGPVAL